MVGLLDGRYFVLDLAKIKTKTLATLYQLLLRRKKKAIKLLWVVSPEKNDKVLTSRTFDSTFFGNGAFAEVIK